LRHEHIDWKIVSDVSKGRSQAAQEELFVPEDEDLAMLQSGGNHLSVSVRNNIPENMNLHLSILHRAAN
jgi:hypothetical protein